MWRPRAATGLRCGSGRRCRPGSRLAWVWWSRWLCPWGGWRRSSTGGRRDGRRATCCSGGLLVGCRRWRRRTRRRTSGCGSGRPGRCERSWCVLSCADRVGGVAAGGCGGVEWFSADGADEFAVRRDRFGVLRRGSILASSVLATSPTHIRVGELARWRIDFAWRTGGELRRTGELAVEFRVPWPRTDPQQTVADPDLQRIADRRPAVITLRERLLDLVSGHLPGADDAEHVGQCQPPGRLLPRPTHDDQVPVLRVVVELRLGHVDVPPVGGDVAAAARIVGVFTNEPPCNVGPVAQPGVAAGTFRGVPHVVDDEGVGDGGFGEQFVEGDEELPGVVVFV